MLSDRCPACLSVLSVCNVGVLWPIKRLDGSRRNFKLGMQVGLDPGHYCVRWGLSSPSPKGHSPRQFSVHICCS